MKKLMILMLSLIMVIIPLTATAEVGGITNPVLSDMPEDWSTQALQNAIENGLLTGFDGKIMPKDKLTRAQMATIINRAFGATQKASLEGFTDVNLGDWFYDEMAKAVAMGTFKGDGNNLYPNNPITREESFVVIARALKLQPSNAVPAGLTDLGNISDWAKGEVYALINAGYISGSNGLLNPKSSITRAEFAQVMYNTISAYVSTPMEYTSAAAGNLMVNVPGVTLKDMTIDGDLIVGDGVGSGNLILDNVTVTGRMVVRGGGENSIIIRGTSNISQIIVANVNGAVRILTEEGAVVDAIYVNDGENKVVIEGEIGILTIQSDVPVMLVNATVKNVIIEAENSSLDVDSKSNIDSLTVDKNAGQTSINVEGTIKEVIIEAPKASIGGNGSVTSVDIKEGADNSSIKTTDTVISIESGVVGTVGTGDTVLEGGTEVTNGKEVTEKPIVKDEEKPAEKPDRDDDDRVTKLRLRSATMGGETFEPTGDTLLVPFNEGKPGIITATFNKPINKIASISTNRIDDIDDSVSLFNTILGKANIDGNTLSITVNTSIKAEYLTTYGNEVYVTVRDNDGQSLKVTIIFE